MDLLFPYMQTKFESRLQQHHQMAPTNDTLMHAFVSSILQNISVKYSTAPPPRTVAAYGLLNQAVCELFHGGRVQWFRGLVSL